MIVAIEMMPEDRQQECRHCELHATLIVVNPSAPDRVPACYTHAMDEVAIAVQDYLKR